MNIDVVSATPIDVTLVAPATIDVTLVAPATIDVEGLILPNDSLSNFQLIEAAKKLKIKHFRGVFVRDELPMKPGAVECGILNTGDSSTNGFHWICWSKSGTKKICFDSYGLPPPVELVQYLKSPVYSDAAQAVETTSQAVETTSQAASVYYNSERVQFGNTVFCGHLCLYVLKRLDVGDDFQEIINGLW